MDSLAPSRALHVQEVSAMEQSWNDAPVLKHVLKLPTWKLFSHVKADNFVEKMPRAIKEKTS